MKGNSNANNNLNKRIQVILSSARAGAGMLGRVGVITPVLVGHHGTFALTNVVLMLKMHLVNLVA